MNLTEFIGKIVHIILRSRFKKSTEILSSLFSPSLVLDIVSQGSLVERWVLQEEAFINYEINDSTGLVLLCQSLFSFVNQTLVRDVDSYSISSLDGQILASDSTTLNVGFDDTACLKVFKFKSAKTDHGTLHLSVVYDTAKDSVSNNNQISKTERGIPIPREQSKINNLSPFPSPSLVRKLTKLSNSKVIEKSSIQEPIPSSISNLSQGTIENQLLGLNINIQTPILQPNSSLFGSFVGSYEQSLLNGRMSTFPSKPLWFSLDIGVIGMGNCKSKLKCPQHRSITFPAYYYEFENDALQTTPYVGNVDIEGNQHKHGYRIPFQGQLQIFLIPYDLSDMPLDTKTYLRQKSYLTKDQMPSSHPFSFSRTTSSSELHFNGNDILQHAIHLQVICTKQKRLYIHHSIRVVFSHRIPDQKLRVVNEVPLDPRFFPIDLPQQFSNIKSKSRRSSFLKSRTEYKDTPLKQEYSASSFNEEASSSLIDLTSHPLYSTLSALWLYREDIHYSIPCEDLQAVVNSAANALLSVSLDGIEIDDLTIVLLSSIIVLGDQVRKSAQTSSSLMSGIDKIFVNSSLELKSVCDQIMSEMHNESESDFTLEKEDLDDDYERSSFLKSKNTLKWTGRSRKRPNHSKSVIELLKKWLHSHASHPYPSENQKSELCKLTGLSMLQLNNWFINDYGSSDEDNKIIKKFKDYNPAPAVHSTSFDYLPSAGTVAIPVNLPLSRLNAPVLGPQNPFAQEASNKNILTGFIEEHYMDEDAFNSLKRSFGRHGYTIDPETGKKIGDGKISKDRKESVSNKNKRKPKGKAEDVDSFVGPWAKFEGESSEEETVEPLIEEPVKEREQVSAPKAEAVETVHTRESTKFHGVSEVDYLGRSFIHVPADVDVDLTSESGSQICYAPKKLLHSFVGHTKGVTTMRLFPQSGHLVLSGSQDTKIKIWDIYHDRKCLRTYQGHDKPIKDLAFSNDGKKFLSASHDKWIKLWDTETGKCISRFYQKNGVPMCVTFHPDNKKQNIFLSGCQDKKIYQYDLNSGAVVQEYDQHLGSVNTITFFDENRRFITSSDDKTIRAWEYDIPVVIKNMSDPGMKSMPAACMSPNKKYIAFQSIDNQLVSYSASDRLVASGRKVYRGHVVAGNIIRPSFSPDNKYITSGDSSGNVYLWDWKTTKLFKKFKAHDSVVTATDWLPHETSKMITSSMDATLKLWD